MKKGGYPHRPPPPHNTNKYKTKILKHFFSHRLDYPINGRHTNIVLLRQIMHDIQVFVPFPCQSFVIPIHVKVAHIPYVHPVCNQLPQRRLHHIQRFVLCHIVLRFSITSTLPLTLSISSTDTTGAGISLIPETIA